MNCYNSCIIFAIFDKKLFCGTLENNSSRTFCFRRLFASNKMKNKTARFLLKSVESTLVHFCQRLWPFYQVTFFRGRFWPCLKQANIFWISCFVSKNCFELKTHHAKLRRSHSLAHSVVKMYIGRYLMWSRLMLYPPLTFGLIYSCVQSKKDIDCFYFLVNVIIKYLALKLSYI